MITSTRVPIGWNRSTTCSTSGVGSPLGAGGTAGASFVGICPSVGKKYPPRPSTIWELGAYRVGCAALDSWAGEIGLGVDPGSGAGVRAASSF